MGVDLGSIHMLKDILPLDTLSLPINPTPQKGHGTRDNLPLEVTWDQGPGRDLAPEISYPLWTE